jgi:hypothetical protein
MIGNSVARVLAKVAGVALAAASVLAVGPGGAQTASAQPLACQLIGNASGTVKESSL